ncbi:hypothetical protein AX16_010506, partial [Volvariella volvacea WC 439]
MRFFTATVSSLFFVGATLAGPLLAPIERYSGETTEGYIVKVKKGTVISTLVNALNINDNVKCQMKSLNAFSGNFDAATLALIRASPNVELVSEDGIMHTTAVTTQTDAPWGLARISSQERLASNDPLALNYQYRYDDSAGNGVDIYILGEQMMCVLEDFGGRARQGAVFGPYPVNEDGNGHGTHCAGTAAGTTYGVAKKANIIAVKVMSDAGSGFTSDIICGINWVVEQAKESGHSSIISMSLGGGVSTALDDAVEGAVQNGIHVVVAAGNSNVDAVNTSPARAPNAVTVGASDITETRASFSNYGSVVDIFAPGVNITSAWIGTTAAKNTISGTSMATPHVA